MDDVHKWLVTKLKMCLSSNGLSIPLNQNGMCTRGGLAMSAPRAIQLACPLPFSCIERSFAGWV